MIELYFENYDEIALEIEDVKAGINTDKVGRNSTPSSPTEVIAIRNLTPVNKIIMYGFVLYNPERWLDVVDATYNYYKDKKEYQLMQMRYQRNEQREKICQKLKISITQYRCLLHEIISFAKGVATGMGIYH